MQLNSQAELLCKQAVADQASLRIAARQEASGATLLDFGVHVDGGIRAGLLLATICLGGAAEVRLSSCSEIGNTSTSFSPTSNHGLTRALSSAGSDRVALSGGGISVQVSTDDPVIACMGAQYAGWPVQLGKFYAMGSGPMRVKRGREHVLESLNLRDDSDDAVGVLECDVLPNEAICRLIAEECGVSPGRLTLCVAPTRSLAGTIQVVARSVETCLHKLFELGFDLRQVLSAFGSAPLPPPAIDFVQAIGRTNDAILYGGEVTLWVRSEDQAVRQVLEQLPSCSSKDWGKPFAEIFRQYGGDFYQVDPGLFAPAVVRICNLQTGKSWRIGDFRADVLATSFQVESIDASYPSSERSVPTIVSDGA